MLSGVTIHRPDPTALRTNEIGRRGEGGCKEDGDTRPKSSELKLELTGEERAYFNRWTSPGCRLGTGRPGSCPGLRPAWRGVASDAAYWGPWPRLRPVGWAWPGRCLFEGAGPRLRPAWRGVASTTVCLEGRGLGCGSFEEAGLRPAWRGVASAAASS